MRVRQRPAHPRPFRRSTVLLIAGLAVAACSDSSGPHGPPVNVIEVSPPTANREVGQSLQYTAVAKEADGTEISGVAFEWVTTNPAVASVNDAGLVTAVGLGTTSVQASAGGKVGTATFTVSPPIGSITVTPEDTLMGVGKTLQLSAALTDLNGAPVTRTVDWVSTVATVASVSNAGIVTAVGEGTTTIVGSVGTKSDVMNLTVVEICSSLLSTPIQVGESRQGLLEANDCPYVDQTTGPDGTFLDGWRITVAADTDVQIDLESTAFDAYLFLLVETNAVPPVAQLADDDDSGGGTNARLVVTLEAGKVYHILANNLDPAQRGAYTLTISDAQGAVLERGPTPRRVSKSIGTRSVVWPKR